MYTIGSLHFLCGCRFDHRCLWRAERPTGTSERGHGGERTFHSHSHSPTYGAGTEWWWGFCPLKEILSDGDFMCIIKKYIDNKIMMFCPNILTRNSPIYPLCHIYSFVYTNLTIDLYVKNKESNDKWYFTENIFLNCQLLPNYFPPWASWFKTCGLLLGLKQIRVRVHFRPVFLVLQGKWKINI